jgi:glutamyl-Q tRNA(Asp) synthetase
LSEQIPATLIRFGFEWDGNIQFQSDRIESYTEALDQLVAAGRCYPCRCSRAAMAVHHATHPASEPVYPGTCRGDREAGSGPYALRYAIDVEQPPVEFTDEIQGPVRQDCRAAAGDFVVRRRDGPVAYHLAVVVDDERQGVTEVVRGADLLSCTPRQILLQQALGFRRPRYGHLPVLTEPDGRKLAKSRRSVPLAAREAPRQLWQVLGWLELEPPPELARAKLREIWDWAVPNWRPERVAGRRERRLPPAVVAG